MKIVTIVGARPQFVKAAVVSRVLAGAEGVEEIIVHTGQHFDANMSDVFFEEMCIPKPHYNLNINGLGHGAMTGQMLEKIEEVLIKEKPEILTDWLQSEAAKDNALLSSFNMDMPEEINRILTDRISDVLFCPTGTAVENLKREGFENMGCRIVKNGDVMQDAALFYAEKAKQPELTIPEHFVLGTVHRAENTDNPERLMGIFSALENISETWPVVLPLHPRTRGKLIALNYDFSNSKIYFIDPVGYLEMVWLLKNCKMVMTDSGGLQKEAYFFGKYCVTMRDETEWVELVENGFNLLAGSDHDRILQSVKELQEKGQACFENRLYGKGDAGEKVLKVLQTA